jgi:hypothetical protein
MVLIDLRDSLFNLAVNLDVYFVNKYIFRYLLAKKHTSSPYVIKTQRTSGLSRKKSITKIKEFRA